MNPKPYRMEKAATRPNSESRGLDFGGSSRLKRVEREGYVIGRKSPRPSLINHNVPAETWHNNPGVSCNIYTSDGVLLLLEPIHRD